MKNTVQIDRNKLPRHIAVIMDGNGRWAKSKGLQRVLGHKNGVKAVRETVETCAELGVKNLTLFAFSTENWKRPKLEIATLMELLVSSLRKELPTMNKNKIKLSAIGQLDKLPSNVLTELNEVMNQTAHNNHMNLVLAISYGGREEIVRATQKIGKLIQENKVQIEDINEELIQNQLYTANIPDVDLVIRTSGEHRISNFLLWQLAFAELYFTPTLWPDFRKEHLVEAILNYQNRERRFGKISEQL